MQSPEQAGESMQTVAQSGLAGAHKMSPRTLCYYHHRFFFYRTFHRAHDITQALRFLWKEESRPPFSNG
jgi:hypothetical protein